MSVFVSFLFSKCEAAARSRETTHILLNELGELGVKFFFSVEAAYHLTLGINDELRGDVLDSIVVGILATLVEYVAVKLKTAVLSVDEFLPCVLVTVERHCEDSEVLILVSVIDALYVGE